MKTGFTIEVWESISTVITHHLMDAITYPFWDLRYSILIKGPLVHPDTCRCSSTGLYLLQYVLRRFSYERLCFTLCTMMWYQSSYHELEWYEYTYIQCFQFIKISKDYWNMIMLITLIYYLWNRERLHFNLRVPINVYVGNHLLQLGFGDITSINTFIQKKIPLCFL